MNRKLNNYVNYLLDNNPSPFCDYIICKELLKLDDKTVRDAYEWAIRFKLYREMSEEQFPDGSFGDFWPMSTKPEVRRKIKHTHRHTHRRLRDLSLDEKDEMVAKTIELCKKTIIGEYTPFRFKRTDNSLKGMKHTLYSFLPNDELCADIKKEQLNLSEEKQRIYMTYEWDHGPWDLCKRSDLLMPDSKYFVFWMCGLEEVSNNPLFAEFAAEKTVPFLYELCEKLIDPDDAISIKVNRYYAKVGQYSEEWSNYELKKKDLLLRIIRILNKCD